MSTPAVERLPAGLVDAAISWAIRIEYNSPTPEMRRAFEAWLTADPSHQVAWERIRSLKPGPRGDPAAKLVRDTLGAVDAGRAGRRRRRAIKLLMLAGGGSVVALAGWRHQPWVALSADASTRVGEQKQVLLGDGTQVMLNTDTAIRTEFSDEQRVIRLLRGEIRITTGDDADHRRASGRSRSLWVKLPFGRVRAIGTRFVVRLDGQRARIDVAQGAVELYPAGAARPVAIVDAGEGRWLSAAAATMAEPDPFAGEGWTEGVISGQKMRLADLLAQLERYRPGRIRCDERVADLRVSGVFHVADTDRALKLLARTQPIRIDTWTRYWVRVGPASEN